MHECSNLGKNDAKVGGHHVGACEGLAASATAVCRPPRQRHAAAVPARGSGFKLFPQCGPYRQRRISAINCACMSVEIPDAAFIADIHGLGSFPLIAARIQSLPVSPLYPLLSSCRSRLQALQAPRASPRTSPRVLSAAQRNVPFRCGRPPRGALGAVQFFSPFDLDHGAAGATWILAPMALSIVTRSTISGSRTFCERWCLRPRAAAIKTFFRTGHGHHVGDDPRTLKPLPRPLPSHTRDQSRYLRQASLMPLIVLIHGPYADCPAPGQRHGHGESAPSRRPSTRMTRIVLRSS